LINFEEQQCLEAHDTDILSLDISSELDENNTPVPKMMASVGRDRMLHIFEADNNFEHIQSKKDHSSSIVSVKFSQDNKFLVTCSADRSIVFREFKQVGFP